MLALGRPVDIELAVARRVPLKEPLESLVTFGLLKEMTCAADGSIYSPSNRKYSSAVNAVVRFPQDASSFTAFSIDSLPKLEGGTVVDFDLGPSGELYVLAREVLKYSEFEVPLKFGESFIVHFDRNAHVLSQVRLNLDTDRFDPTGIATLSDGRYLVVGSRRVADQIIIASQIFNIDGSLRLRFDLSRVGTKASNKGSVRSPRVIHPVAIKANGVIYVMRGTTTEPVHVMSERGDVLKSIQLSPAGLEFDSPKIYENELIVSEHPPISDEQENTTGPVFFSGPERENFPVFSLDTGTITSEYYWREMGKGMACYAPGNMTFIGQDLSAPRGSGWAIFTVKPTTSGKAPGVSAGNAPHRQAAKLVAGNS